MKKLSVLSLALVLALLLAAPLYAGEGSDTVGDGKLMPELRYSYMQTELSTKFPLLDAGTYKLTMHDVYAQFNWGVHRNIDIYALAGARFDSLDADLATLAIGLPIDINVKYNSSANFLYGLGVKATFFRADNGFYVGGGLLFTHSYGSGKKLKISGTVAGTDIGPIVEASGIPTKISTRIITLTPDIHVGWHFKNIGLTPYLGVEYRWAWAEASYDIGQLAPIDWEVDLNFDQKNAVGIFAGLDYSVNDRLYFNVEGNVLDRWGVSAGFGYLFDICEKPEPAPATAPIIEPKLEPMSKN